MSDEIDPLKRVKFAKAIKAGLNQSQAAALAGYSRMHGTRLARELAVSGDHDSALKNPGKAAQAAKSPLAWAEYVSNGAFKRAPHFEFFEKTLLRVESGESTRVVISVPPQHGKSTTVTGYFSSWWLGRNPTHRVLVVTMQGNYSKEWGRFSRDALVARGQEVFGVTALARGSASAWSVYKNGRRTGGGLNAVGILGSLPGKRGDVAIVDDIIRSHVEAESKTLRDQHWNAFQSGVLTRLAPPGRVIIVMTRWHQDDLIGRLKIACETGEIGDPYEFVELPALAEENDPLGRKPGEALWPEVRNAEWLERAKQNFTQSQHVWNAQFMCRPTPKTGAIFQRPWFRYYTLDQVAGNVQLPVYDRTAVVKPGEVPAPVVRRWPEFWAETIRFATVDLAVSMKVKADFTVIASWAYHRVYHALVLLEVHRTRIAPESIVPTLLEVQTRLDLAMVYVERPGPLLQGRIGPLEADAADAGVNLSLLTPTRDKHLRAIDISASLAAGRVWFPSWNPRTKDGAAWLPAWEDELTSFTGQGDARDDQVDTLTYACAIFKEWEREMALESRPKPYQGGRGRTPLPEQTEPPAWNPGFSGPWLPPTA